MPRKKSTTLYRPFLRDAWRVTWERKSLWIFGIFAALISTGGVVDVVWQSLQKVQRAESLLENLMNHSFIGYEIASSYINQLGVLGPQRMSFLVIVTTLIGIALVVIATLSQGALLLGIRSKDPEDPYVLRTKAGAHFWSFFVVGVLNKVLTGILIVLMALPLWLITLSTVPGHAVIFFLLMLLFIPACIIVNMIYMFALIDIVEKNAHPLDAIHAGMRLFAKQWLASIEYGILLFFLVFGAGVVFLILLSLLLVPYSIAFTAILLTGSFPLFLSLNILSGFLVVLLIILFGGICVTFQYSAWYIFYKRGLHKTHGKKAFSKILRVFSWVS